MQTHFVFTNETFPWNTESHVISNKTRKGDQIRWENVELLHLIYRDFNIGLDIAIPIITITQRFILCKPSRVNTRERTEKNGKHKKSRKGERGVVGIFSQRNSDVVSQNQRAS